MSVSLDGTVDLHVHTAPDLVERHAYDIDLARTAIEAGMRGIVVKSHVVPTVGRVDQVNRAVGQEILYGGVALNAGTGGVNPDAVQIALELGARIIWLPTAWSANHAQQARAAGESTFAGQRIPDPDEELSVTNNGSLTDDARAVIDLVSEHDAVLGTGHITADETDAVVSACADADVNVLVNHPFFRITDLSIEQQESLAEQGATLEYCRYAVGSTDGHSIDRIAEAVSQIGAEHCVLATDYGQQGNPPVEGLETFAEEVIDAGLSEQTVQRLVRENPTTLLGL